MNTITKNTTFYIIVFFVMGILGLGGYFYYINYIYEPEKADLSFLDGDERLKKELEEIEKERMKRLEEKKKNPVLYTDPPCFIGNTEYPDGSRKIFYARRSVGVYQSCADFSKEKICDAGIWLGDKNYKYSECKRSIDCKLADGSIVKNKESIELFSRRTVPYGDSCDKYKGKRTCKESILAGNRDFQYLKCRVIDIGTCKIKKDNGEIIVLANAKAKTFYSKNKVDYYDNCQNYSQKRICSNGFLYGDREFKYLTCQKEEPKNCNVNGINIDHGSLITLYSKQRADNGKTCDFFAQIRKCDNGELSGQEEYVYNTCAD